MVNAMKRKHNQRVVFKYTVVNAGKSKVVGIGGQDTGTGEANSQQSTYRLCLVHTPLSCITASQESQVPKESLYLYVSQVYLKCITSVFQMCIK